MKLPVRALAAAALALLPLRLVAQDGPGLNTAVVPAAASAPLNLSEEPPGSTILLLVTRRTYDDFDRLETETTTLPDGTGERTVLYTYYRNGVRKTVADPQGNVTFYTYDAQKRVQTVTTRYGTASAKTTTFGYWPDGLLKEVQYPNGVVASYGYDLADRLLTLTHARGGEVISSYEYTYDRNGNRLSQTETNGGLTDVTTYTYDPLNRLKSVTYPADTVYPRGRRVEYGYDAVGNRTSELTLDPVSGEVLASKTGTFDAVNRLQVLTNDLDPEDTATFTWDPNGNQTGKTQRGVTTTSVYDLQDRVVEVQQGTAVLGRFLYDFAGRRTEKIGAEGVRQYVYDQTSLLAEYSDTGLQVAKYDYGPDRLISLERSGQRRYYLFDALRSVTNITDESGLTQASYHLDAWGNFRFPGELDSSDSAASRNRFAFTGYLWDQETALYYAKARFYDPEVGRFTSQDAFLGDVSQPPSLHRYVYARNQPTLYVDPDGNIAIVDNLVGGVASVAIGWGLSKVTGQEYTWKDAAVDFGLGAVTSGLSSINRIRQVAQMGRAAQVGTRIGAEGALDLGAEVVRNEWKGTDYNIVDLATGTLQNTVVGEGGTAVSRKVARHLPWRMPKADAGASANPSPAQQAAVIQESRLGRGDAPSSLDKPDGSARPAADSAVPPPPPFSQAAERRLLPELTPSTQDAIRRLRADSNPDFPLSEVNARRAIVGPGGITGEVAGPGVPGGDVVFQLSDRVLRREVKSVIGDASAFSKRVSEGAKQIGYSGGVLIQVPPGTDVPSFLENFKTRRSAEALEKYKSIHIDVVDSNGNVLFSGSPTK